MAQVTHNIPIGTKVITRADPGHKHLYEAPYGRKAVVVRHTGFYPYLLYQIQYEDTGKFSSISYFEGQLEVDDLPV